MTLKHFFSYVTVKLTITITQFKEAIMKSMVKFVEDNPEDGSIPTFTYTLKVSDEPFYLRNLVRSRVLHGGHQLLCRVVRVNDVTTTFERQKVI